MTNILITEARKRKEIVISDGQFEFETSEDWDEFRKLLEKLSSPVLFYGNKVTVREVGTL